MKETTTEQNKNKFGHWLRTSTTARMLTVGFLIIVLLIPLAYISDLIKERKNRQQDVISEINNQWGKEVLINGPVLKVPYKVYTEKTVTDTKTKRVYTETIEETKNAYFYPELLNIQSSINPEEKKRGIYTTAVYNSSIALKGKFKKPDFSEIDITDEQILWNKARVIIQTSNLKGVYEASLKLNNTNYALSSKYNNQDITYQGYVRLHNLESKAIDTSKNGLFNELKFNVDFSIKGSEQIRFAPIGKETEAQITSNWKDANFFGEFLPYNEDKITETGFDAKWKILDFNRGFSQQHFGYLPDLREFAFGVNFMIPVDQYQQSERSVKYGFLVIALTFLVFFLIQTLSDIPIHPFQYLMIGLALTMFYTLLVSISEHSNFFQAYLIAGVSVVVLISLYSKSILKTIKFPIFIALSLAALYTFIYVIIQLENYALLVGSIGLFLILTIIMYVSRKIDWQHS
jgi:inner membrane protein